MLKKIPNQIMGTSDNEWLDTKFHFSFANYFNPDNINFGVLRVINDDIISPNIGFPTHPHDNMEIITYVIDGKLTHKDSMDHEFILERGGIQYMSAGTGITHSEYNNQDVPLHLLQIWIYPDQKGYDPQYGQVETNLKERKNKLLHLVSPKTSDAPIHLHQDANIYVSELDAGSTLEFNVQEHRQAYLVQIEGQMTVNDVHLSNRDGLMIINEELKITAETDSHFLLIEMKES